ncbi:mitochondrial ribosomal protein, L28 [Culex quinquefasciatus]|uniref:Mitochondrial ribosomal protein, L28 n=1 Tax=Culex quinquefasciatus TaxID=7176 RepID=B0XL40_CULQU|nr:mitochondrial ribosomal protein, L28 [Culex quinquefasciatus]|eukprot:XP_001870362.1 mitochondrial ribosomal protein, L28 [Culex quinquefasciatus]
MTQGYVVIQFWGVLHDKLNHVTSQPTVLRSRSPASRDTPACDLRSMLAIKLKKKILVDLLAGCPKLAAEPEKQQAAIKEFSCYLSQYTPEEIDWYGLSYVEAVLKIKNQVESQADKRPHKVIFRQKLIEQLKEAGIREAQGTADELKTVDDSSASSWLSKLAFKPKNW